LDGRLLFDHSQVLTLDVLNQREFERSSLVEPVVHQRGDRRFNGELGGTPTALARDQLEPASGARPDDDRLQHASLADRVSERGERRLVEVLTRLVGVGVNLLESELAQPVLSEEITRGRVREVAAWPECCAMGAIGRRS